MHSTEQGKVNLPQEIAAGEINIRMENKSLAQVFKDFLSKRINKEVSGKKKLPTL